MDGVMNTVGDSLRSTLLQISFVSPARSQESAPKALHDFMDIVLNDLASKVPRLSRYTSRCYPVSDHVMSFSMHW